MLPSFSHPSPADVVIGGFLLRRSGRRSNPSRREERRGGVAFLVLGSMIGVAGLVNLWLD